MWNKIGDCCNIGGCSFQLRYGIVCCVFILLFRCLAVKRAQFSDRRLTV